jgi:hypothetical protein
VLVPEVRAMKERYPYIVTETIRWRVRTSSEEEAQKHVFEHAYDCIDCDAVSFGYSTEAEEPPDPLADVEYNEP